MIDERADDALDRAEAALRAGGAVVLPTDTVYGLAALPDHVDLLLELKGRPARVPIAVLVVDAEAAWAALGGLPPPPAAVELADRFWPGPLTMVLKTAAGPTLGVRCPAAPFVSALAARVGPIATTSANRHGEPTPATAAAAAAALVAPPALVVDGGPCVGVASTVVDLSVPGISVLREGTISGDAIRDAVT